MMPNVWLMSEVRVNDVLLYVEQRGSGTPILCIHGTGSSAMVWETAAATLTDHGRVISYDRRGCTRSERPEPYADTAVSVHADDAAVLLAALDAAPAIVIGRSWGGEVAVDLVTRWSDSVLALVLLEPAILSLSPAAVAFRDDLAAQVFGAADNVGPAAAAELFYRRLLGDQTWDAFPEVIREMVRHNGPAILAELRAETRFVPDRGALAQVTQPTLIISGEDSPSVFRSVDDVLTEMMPTARHHVVGGGHMVDPAGPIVLEFLASVRP